MTQLDLATNPDTSAEILEELARDSDYNVIWYTVRHINVTPKILTRLASWQHDNFENCTWVIRDQVRQHPDCPPLVKMWLRGGYGSYSEMSLEEFLEAAK